MPKPDEHGPRYRFWGSVKPPSGRQPVRAQLGASEKAGVATIRLYDPIDSWGDDFGVSAKEFTAALDEIPDASEIRLHINCPGGEVYEGIAILNALRNHPANVVAIVDGLAASAASFIAAGADETIMGRNTQLMIHDAHGICIGAAVDMRDLAGRMDQVSDNIASVYAAKSGGSVADWRAAMLAETWYSADEAVTAGLADRVQPGDAAPISAAFDLSTFTYPGRAAAPAPRLAARMAMPAEPAEPATTDDHHMLVQTLGWLSAIGSIADDGQETLADHLGLANPDDDGMDGMPDMPAAMARHRLNAARHHLPL